MSLSTVLVAVLVAAPVRSPARWNESAETRTRVDVHESAEFGFRLELPDGWSAAAGGATGLEVHKVTVYPEEDADRKQLSVRVFSANGVGGAEGAREMAMVSVKDQEQYRDWQLTEANVAGVEAPAFRVVTESSGSDLRVHQAYLAESGFVYVLQSIALDSEYDELADEFERVWLGFELIPLADEVLAVRRLEELADRLRTRGSDWAKSWDAAVERAEAERKPILVSARFYPGFSLTDETMRSTFMDPDVIELVEEHFVPFRLQSPSEVPFADPELFGLSGSTFGTAAMIVHPDGRVLAQREGASYGFLRTHADAGGLGGEAVPRGAPRLERAEAHLRRGELEEVHEVLDRPRSAREHYLRAVAYRRGWDGANALEQLERAGATAEGEQAGDVAVERALVLMRTNAIADARKELSAFLDLRPEHARANEARYLLGTLARHPGGGGRAEAERIWRELVETAPDDRWGWKAAATLVSTTWELDLGKRVHWPPLEQVEAALFADYEPLEPRQWKRAERDAIEYLLGSQEADGSWVVPVELSQEEDAVAHDFELAAVAVCIQGLLPHRDDDRVEEAVERAATWLEAAYADAVARAPGRLVHRLRHLEPRLPPVVLRRPGRGRRSLRRRAARARGDRAR